MTQDDKPPPPPLPQEAVTAPLETSRDWHFSLRTMLVIMTAFAIWCALTTQFPGAMSKAQIGLVWIVATGWLVTGLFYARGDQRAFCIGASVVVFAIWTRIDGRFFAGVFPMPSLVSGGLRSPGAIMQWLELALIAAVAAANGWVCIRARRYFEKPGG